MDRSPPAPIRRCSAPSAVRQLKSTPKKITAMMIEATATGATNRMKDEKYDVMSKVTFHKGPDFIFLDLLLRN